MVADWKFLEREMTRTPEALAAEQDFIDKQWYGSCKEMKQKQMLFDGMFYNYPTESLGNGGWIGGVIIDCDIVKAVEAIREGIDTGELNIDYLDDEYTEVVDGKTIIVIGLNDMDDDYEQLLSEREISAAKSTGKALNLDIALVA